MLICWKKCVWENIYSCFYIPLFSFQNRRKKERERKKGFVTWDVWKTLLATVWMFAGFYVFFSHFIYFCLIILALSFPAFSHSLPLLLWVFATRSAQFQIFKKLSHEPVHTPMPSDGTPVQLTLLSWPDSTPAKQSRWKSIKEWISACGLVLDPRV